MRLNDLFLHVKTKLRDTNANLFSEEEIKDSCSLAYEELAKELGIFRKLVELESFEKRDFEVLYPKPRDMVRIISLKMNGKMLEIKSFDYVHGIENFTQKVAYVLNDCIVVTNALSEEKLTLAYGYTKTIKNLEDELEVPNIALDCLVNFSLYLLKRENRNDSLQKANYYLNFYKQGLAGLQDSIRGYLNAQNITSTYSIV